MICALLYLYVFWGRPPARYCVLGGSFGVQCVPRPCTTTKDEEGATFGRGPASLQRDTEPLTGSCSPHRPRYASRRNPAAYHLGEEKGCLEKHAVRPDETRRTCTTQLTIGRRGHSFHSPPSEGHRTHDRERPRLLLRAKFRANGRSAAPAEAPKQCSVIGNNIVRGGRRGPISQRATARGKLST